MLVNELLHPGKIFFIQIKAKVLGGKIQGKSLQVLLPVMDPEKVFRECFRRIKIKSKNATSKTAYI